MQLWQEMSWGPTAAWEHVYICFWILRFGRKWHNDWYPLYVSYIKSISKYFFTMYIVFHQIKRYISPAAVLKRTSFSPHWSKPLQTLAPTISKPREFPWFNFSGSMGLTGFGWASLYPNPFAVIDRDGILSKPKSETWTWLEFSVQPFKTKGRWYHRLWLHDPLKRTLCTFHTGLGQWPWPMPHVGFLPSSNWPVPRSPCHCISWHNMLAWRAKYQLTPHAFCSHCHGHVSWPCSCACHGERGLVGGGQQNEVLPANILCIPDHVGAKKILSLLGSFCSFVLLGDTWMEFSRHYLLIAHSLYRMGTPNNFTFTKGFWNRSKKGFRFKTKPFFH